MSTSIADRVCCQRQAFRTARESTCRYRKTAGPSTPLAASWGAAPVPARRRRSDRPGPTSPNAPGCSPCPDPGTPAACCVFAISSRAKSVSTRASLGSGITSAATAARYQSHAAGCHAGGPGGQTIVESVTPTWAGRVRHVVAPRLPLARHAVEHRARIEPDGEPVQVCGRSFTS